MSTVITRTLSSHPPSVADLINPVGMIRGLYFSRDLIRQFIWREVMGRYKGTYFGVIWSIVNPLMMLFVYSLVFGVILKARFGTEPGQGQLHFVLNLFCGLLLYEVFSGCVSRASTLIVANTNYVKRVVFPLEILPVTVLGANMVNAAMGFAILIPAVVLYNSQLSLTMCLFPLVLIPLCSLTLGLSWLLASLGAFVRDIGQPVAVMIQLLFFISPIIYPLSASPEALRLLMRINPLTTIMEDARNTLLLGKSPEWAWWAVVTALSMVFMQLGYVWFMKSKRAFADVI